MVVKLLFISYKFWETVPSSKYEPEEEALGMFEAAEAEATAAAAATAALRSLFMLDSRAFKSSLSRRPSRFSVYLLLRL